MVRLVGQRRDHHGRVRCPSSSESVLSQQYAMYLSTTASSRTTRPCRFTTRHQAMCSMRMSVGSSVVFFCFQAEDGIRDADVTGVQTCALPIYTATTEIYTLSRLVSRGKGIFGSSTLPQSLRTHPV